MTVTTNGTPTQRRTHPPLGLLLPGVIAVFLLGLPLVAVVLRAPWGSLGDILADDTVRQALFLSLGSATAATLLSFLLGVPLAWMLARFNFPGKRLLRALVTVPMVLPPVVGGVALLLAFGRRGILGGPLYDLTGISLPFTVPAVILAQTFVAMPFLIITATGAFESMDTRYEEAAGTLGASRFTTFRTVTLRLAGPSLVAGAVLCWTRALGEFGATITFAGNFPGRTQTMPLSVYLALERNPDAAFALSLLLLAVSILVLVLMQRQWVGAASQGLRWS